MLGTVGDLNCVIGSWPIVMGLALVVGGRLVLGCLKEGVFGCVKFGLVPLSGDVMLVGETWFRVRVSEEYCLASVCSTLRMSSVISRTISGFWLTGMSPFFIGLMPWFSACCPYHWSMATMFA
ncbi:hypothetical protein OHT68_10135 [Streptomyces canus]|uniref:hypothetical protein n=1 Tax=Streptomyces canus TaxID=58343 RepID=UPI002E29C45D|nr:hypothetical protein [Streptomyces canus]